MELRDSEHIVHVHSAHTTHVHIDAKHKSHETRPQKKRKSHSLTHTHNLHGEKEQGKTHTLQLIRSF